MLHPSSDQLKELVEDLLVPVHQVLNAALQLGIRQRVGGLLALAPQKLLVSQRILDVQKLLGTHVYHLRHHSARKAAKVCSI